MFSPDIRLPTIMRLKPEVRALQNAKRGRITCDGSRATLTSQYILLKNVKLFGRLLHVLGYLPSLAVPGLPAYSDRFGGFILLMGWA